MCTDDIDPAEVRGLAGGGVHEVQECDSSGPGVWGAQAKFFWRSFCARGYFVSTVGRDEETIREYIRHQEYEDQRLDQMNLWR
jgi:hypothetical protein